MIEYLDILDENRNVTGRLHERGKFMNAGDYHLVVCVWVVNSNGEFLISKRSPVIVNGFGGMWQTTGGAAVTGDDSLTTALKETYEEIGVILSPENGQLYKQYSRPHIDDDGVAFYDVWIFQQDIDISTIKLELTETCDAMWASKERIRQMADEGIFMSEWYPYLEEMFLFCNVNNNSISLLT